ncbi:MAG: tannase/feruloyl esterase family alpha/beta hydrolase [Sphingomonas fennica]
MPIGLMMAAAAAAAIGGGDCAALADGRWLHNGTVATARPVAAAGAAPAYCEVTATLTPVEGSRIGVVYRLPAQWNGKLLGLGGGGWAGNVRLDAALEGLGRGYAVAQTDGGHPGTDPWNTDWAASAPAITDFQWRAVHETAVAAKAAIARHYGRPQDKAYFQGCSTGGRMALMEAQRFPADYDGIISAAPVYSLQVQTSAILRGQAFAAPGAALDDAMLARVGAAAVAACDMDDGLKDGLIADPRQCGFDPATLACKGGEAAGACLAPAQIAALRTAYDGRRLPDGRWAAFPMSRGGEAGWSRFVPTAGRADATNGGGMMGLKRPIFGDRPVDFAVFTLADATAARAGDFARAYEATDPDLSAFVKRGGRLILWHGENDPGPSPVGTADYYRAVQKAAPEAAATGVRLFMAPGVEHCRGGPGPDQPRALDALEAWVERGTVPATLPAAKADGSVPRPLCPFPGTLHYRGGAPETAAAWECLG